MTYDEIDQFTIVIHHVGGIGGYGPVETLSRLRHVKWVIFDAREESLTAAESPGAPYMQVRRGIGGTDSDEVQFNITRAPSASSLLKPAPSAADYTVILPDGRAQVWGPHTVITGTIPVRLSTIDNVVAGGEVPSPDFISIDAQGAEFSIIEGASRALRSQVVGVLCEAEFDELYDRQPLFYDIASRLRKDDFRLCEIYSYQHFNTAAIRSDFQGKGFLTVGEPLFLKKERAWHESGPPGKTWPPSRNTIQLLKLAATAVAFDQVDYAIVICRWLESSGHASFDELAEKTGVFYIKLLRDLLRESEKGRPADRLLMEEPEGTSAPFTLLSAGTVLRVLLTLTGMLFAAYGRRIARRVTGRATSQPRQPLARILYSYGFRDLAFKHMVRSAKLPYIGSGLAGSLLDTIAKVWVKLVD